MKTNIRLKIFTVICAFITVISVLSGCKRADSDDISTNFEIPERSISDTTILEDGSYKYCLYDDGTAMITEYTGTEKSVNVPETLGGKKVVSIGNYAFAALSMTEVTIGDNIESIGQFAFFASPIEKITFGKKLYAVGISAFDDTPWFESLDGEFVTVGDGLLIKYNGTAKNVKIPDNVKHIGPAFRSNEDILSVEMGNSVLTVGEYAFDYCKSLVYAGIGKNVRYIGDYAFNTCVELRSVVIPDSVKKIGEYSFFTCISILDIRLGKGLKVIESYAFSDCREVKLVMLPRSIERIDSYAFEYCSSIKYTMYEGTQTEFAEINIDTSNYCLLDAERLYGYSGGSYEKQ